MNLPKKKVKEQRAEPHFQAHHSESVLLLIYTVTIYGRPISIK